MNITEELKEKLLKAIKCGQGTDWGYNGEDEFEFDTFNPEVSLKYVVEVLEEHAEGRTEMLTKAMENELWKTHKLGDIYEMDDVGGWKIAYYPIFEDGKTGKRYEEPRALVELPMTIGTDFREVPLRYLKRRGK